MKLIIGAIISFKAKKTPSLLSGLPGATVTYSVELDAMPASPKWRGCTHPLVQSVIDRQLEIRYRSAPFADEVIVGLCVGIETIKGTSEIYLPNEFLLDEDIQIAVYSTHAEIGKLLLHPLKNPVCSRVASCVSEEL